MKPPPEHHDRLPDPPMPVMMTIMLMAMLMTMLAAPPMPMLWELTTVLQYMVAMAESTALPPSSITRLEGHRALHYTALHCTAPQPNTHPAAFNCSAVHYTTLHYTAIKNKTAFHCNTPPHFPILAQGMESTDTAAYW